MKTSTVIAIGIGAALLIAAVTPQGSAASAQKGQQEESAKKIKDLEKERLVALRELADITGKLFQNARVGADALCEANQLLLKAEVDATENEAERIRQYEKFVNAMKDYELKANALKNGPSVTDSLKLKATRLEGEIASEKAKAQVNK